MSLLQNGANKAQLQEILEYIAHNINVPTIGVGGGYAPIGTIISYMGTTAPQDYLICDGDTHNIADYPQLASFFEAQFGSKNYFGGNGTTTFAVPDLKGEFLRGTGTNSHANQGNGANVGVHQDGTKIPDIAAGSTTMYLKKGAAPDSLDTSIGSSKLGGIGFTGEAGSNLTEYFTSRPTNTSVLFCIKAVNAGEVYSTTERVVGTWKNGKPIYQITVSFTTISATNFMDYSAFPTVPFSVMDELISVEGFTYRSDGWIVPHPTYDTASLFWLSLNKSVSKLYMYVTSTGTYKTSQQPAVLTFKYTKTTD